ncbi:hypothetical protein SKM57_09740 [Acinetobacter faecalis]|uniref:hypothetical protein n=1 Tax=Acinetobacter faecalis TaxID=2665161 RepID=UPI002A90C484|nr:hypothetical protein [Acinetobacter faecalis]MDY6468859.1 hypothetical protein [Acinetobacter faecalis]
MALLYLLPIILMGFIYLYFCPVHLHKFRQLEGQILYFRSFFYGVAFFIISVIVQKVMIVLDYEVIFSDIIFTDLIDLSSDYKFLFYINTLFISLIMEIGVILWFYLIVFGGIFTSLVTKTIKKNGIDIENTDDDKLLLLFKELWQKTKLNFKTILLYDSLEDELDRILLESVIEDRALIIHLKDRKFYIGFVQFYRTVKVREELEAVKFVPLRSGYRDKDNLTVKITTEYDENKVYQIVFLKENIVSATYYDEKIFNNFIDKEKKKSLLNRILKKTPH